MTAAPAPVGRFDATERTVHWLNALLFAALILTGAALSLHPVTGLIGHRRLVRQVHLACGLALPVPLLLALPGSWGRALRADLRRLDRWDLADRRWLRATLRPAGERRRARGALRTGKFNAGQKLNAAFTAGGGLVMLGTGCMLRWYRPFPLSLRAGATFVHDWLAVGFVVVIAGHVWMALADRHALGSMVTGRIDARWADRHAPAWVDELGADGVSGRTPPVAH